MTGHLPLYCYPPSSYTHYVQTIIVFNPQSPELPRIREATQLSAPVRCATLYNKLSPPSLFTFNTPGNTLHSRI